MLYTYWLLVMLLPLAPPLGGILAVSCREGKEASNGQLTVGATAESDNGFGIGLSWWCIGFLDT
jgi:hypothetical protein